MRTAVFRAIAAFTIGLLLVPIPAAADEDDAPLSPCSDFLQTADPDSPCTVTARRLLAQFAFARSRDPDGTTLQFPGAVIRYGASRTIEVRLGLPSVVRRVGDDVENRSTDTLIGVKASSGRGRAVAGLTALAPMLGVDFEPVDGTEFDLGITRENTAGGPAHEIESSVQHRVGRGVALRLAAIRRTTPTGVHRRWALDSMHSFGRCPWRRSLRRLAAPLTAYGFM